MDKKLFVEIINFIISQEKREFALTQALKDYGGDMSDFMGFATDVNTHLVQWLEQIMHDDTEYPVISWWLWDAPNRGRGKKEYRTIKLKGKEYDIKTPEDLYDYLMEATL